MLQTLLPPNVDKQATEATVWSGLHGGQDGPGRALGQGRGQALGQQAQVQFQKISPTLPTVSSGTGLPPNPSAHGPAIPSNAGVLFQEAPPETTTLSVLLVSIWHLDNHGTRLAK